jgi:hypothetical protein
MSLRKVFLIFKVLGDRRPRIVEVKFHENISATILKGQVYFMIIANSFGENSKTICTLIVRL